MLGVLDFCMLIIILLINWLLNFIDGKLIWISITEFRKALTNDSHSQTMKLYLAKMVHIYYQDINLIQRVGSRQLASRGSSDQMGHESMELDPMIRAWKHDTSTDHVIAMMINLTYTLSSWGGNEKLFL